MNVTFMTRTTKTVIMTALMAGLLFAVLAGCDDTMDDSAAATRLPGSFVDSPVQGLYYETDTESGMTDESGTFYYMAGETVTFYLGDTELGSTKGQSVITPVHLVDNAEDETNPVVTNMGVMLQSLDEDNNPENGIKISPEVHSMMADVMIDFHMDTESFQNQASVTDLFETMNDAGMFSDGDRTMISPEAARAHMREYMMPHVGTYMSDGDMMM